MRSYKFSDFLLLKETFELPDHINTGSTTRFQHLQIGDVLVGLPHQDIVEFALHVTEDVVDLSNQETMGSIQACIQAIRVWLEDPSEENTTACINAGNNAQGHGAVAVVGSRHHSAQLSAYAAANAARSTHPSNAPICAGNAASYAAAANAYVWSRSNKYDEQVYDQEMNKYISWTRSHHAQAKPNLNKQELEKWVGDGSRKALAEFEKNLPYFLDDLQERNLKPSETTLKQFGVKNFENNTTIIEDMKKAHTISGFYRAIRRSLGL
jgi:hypothetical protein